MSQEYQGSLWLEQSEKAGGQEEMKFEGGRRMAANRSLRDTWPIARTLTFTLSVMGATGGF